METGTAEMTETSAPAQNEVRDGASAEIISAIRQSNQESASDLERMACLGRMVAMVSHELNNRLTGVLGFADLLAMKCEGESSERIKTKLSDCAERLRLLTESLSGFSMSRVRRDENLRLEHVVTQALEVVKCEAKAMGVTLEYQATEDSTKPHACMRSGDLRVGIFLCISAAVKLAARKNQPVKVECRSQGHDLLVRISAGDAQRVPDGQMKMAREMLVPLGVKIEWCREGQSNLLSLLIPGSEGEVGT